MLRSKFMSLGMVFIILGFLLLLETAGIIDGNFWNYLFPTLLILFGLDLILKKQKANDFFNFFKVDSYSNYHSKNKKNRKIVDDQ